jgi:hypothetical protein
MTGMKATEPAAGGVASGVGRMHAHGDRRIR